LPEFGGQIILLVWIWNQGIVGCHHGDVQVDEVSEEGGFVGAWVSRWNCNGNQYWNELEG
jgi:hypothetical protein